MLLIGNGVGFFLEKNVSLFSQILVVQLKPILGKLVLTK